MQEYEDLREVSSVYGGVEFGGTGIQEQEGLQNAGTIRQAGSNLPVKAGFWNKFKSFWLQEIDWKKEIKVELTPQEQEMEVEINEFLHQEITWKKVKDFLFQDLSF